MQSWLIHTTVTVWTYNATNSHTDAFQTSLKTLDLTQSFLYTLFHTTDSKHLSLHNKGFVIEAAG